MVYVLLHGSGFIQCISNSCDFSDYKKKNILIMNFIYLVFIFLTRIMNFILINVKIVTSIIRRTISILYFDFILKF